MSTFAELKIENEKLWNDLHSLTKKSEELEENINKLLTEKELAKAFKPFEVIIDKTFSWGSEKSVKLKFTDIDEYISIFTWKGFSLERDWEAEEMNLFVTLFRKGFYHTPKTYEEAIKRLENLKAIEKEINSLFTKFYSMLHYDEYVECLDAIKDIKEKISKNYNEAKNAFILEKYGELGTIVVGKSYFLYDTSLKSKIAFVEVLEKEESGLGYKCVDHEAGDKKYSHIRANRLEEDLRDFPNSELKFGMKD